MSRSVRGSMTAGVLVFALAMASVQGARHDGEPSAGPTQPIDWTPLLPQVEGRDYAIALCNGCHTAGVLVLQKRTARVWREFLLGMNSARDMGGEICACIGGPLDAWEIQVLTGYLAKAFGPENPIDQLPLNVNTASAGALARLPGLGEADVRKLLQRRSRGAFRDKDEIRRTLGPRVFGKLSDFIDVKDSIFRPEGIIPM